jgi:hydrogenase nickel incorporation protein HypA/HybF
MHELSLAQSLIELIEEEAVRGNFTRARKVWLEIGALAGVEPEALRFGFEVAARTTCAEGAELEIVTPPGTAWCFQCNRTVEIAAYHDGCPYCEGYRLQVTGGTQFKLRELEVA